MSQAFGNNWAQVSLPNGASSAAVSIKKCAGWLSKFPKIYLWFDDDEAGKKALKQAVHSLPPGKVYVVSPIHGCKDASDVLRIHGEKRVTKAVYEAKRYRPEAIVSGADLLKHVVKPIPKGTPYSWDGLQEMLRGVRKGEIIMVCGGSGLGKSTTVRAIALDLAYKSDCRIGYIGLEETVQVGALHMISLKVGVPLLHLEPERLPQEELEREANELGERMCFLDMAFSAADADELKYNITHLVQGMDCDFIVLDHITWVATSDTSIKEGERRKIDILMQTLRGLCNQINAGFIVVSHLKRGEGKSYAEGRRPRMSDLRGSGSLEQVSDIIIGVSREMTSTDIDIQSTLVLEVLKNRPVGLLGEAQSLRYNQETGQLTPLIDSTELSAFEQ